MCDGHGANGHLVSGFLRTSIPETFHAFLTSSDGRNPSLLLLKTYEKVSEDLLSLNTFNIMLSGSTAVSCFIDGNSFFVANVGDSRAVLVRRNERATRISTKALSRDHKADDPLEKPRIIAAGGRVDSYRGNFPIKISNLHEIKGDEEIRRYWESIGSNEGLEDERGEPWFGNGKGIRRC